MAEALARARAEPARRASLRLLVDCPGDAALDSLELFGRGIAIANGSRQFEVGPEVVAAAVDALIEAGFATMPETFGGPAGDPSRPERPGGGAGAAVRAVCRVELTVAGRGHAVVQLARGYQSAELRALARRLLELGARPARRGVGATDLTDGLAKVAAGRLAPETFHLLFHRRPEPPGDGDGLLLRIDGRQAAARALDPAAGFGRERHLRLDAAEVAALAAALEIAPELPVNLWATAYTDLSVSVLDRRRSLQARRFAGMDATTHGPAQRAFDRLSTRLRDLGARVLAEGRPGATE